MKSDSQLKQDIISELNWEPSVHASTIGVEVKDGVVTLAGHVQSYGEKSAAENATQRVRGVKALAVEMDVQLPGSHHRTDADIARSAQGVLQWTTNWSNDAVKVMVEKGWVSLTGTVEWDYQRQSAGWAVKNLMGVTGVSNNIVIKPKVASTSIKADIASALKRRFERDTSSISVDVNGDLVTLSGAVHSWSDRDLVSRSAWGTPGVRDVINNIKIA